MQALPVKEFSHDALKEFKQDLREESSCAAAPQIDSLEVVSFPKRNGGKIQSAG